MIPLIYFSSSLSVIEVSVVAMERSRIGSLDGVFEKSLCFGVDSRLAALSGLTDERFSGYRVGVLMAFLTSGCSGISP